MIHGSYICVNNDDYCVSNNIFDAKIVQLLGRIALRLKIKNQIYIMLLLLPCRCSKSAEFIATTCSKAQGGASRVYLTDSGIESSQPHQKAEKFTTWPFVSGT